MVLPIRPQGTSGDAMYFLDRDIPATHFELTPDEAPFMASYVTDHLIASHTPVVYPRRVERAPRAMAVLSPSHGANHTITDFSSTITSSVQQADYHDSRGYSNISIPPTWYNPPSSQVTAEQGLRNPTLSLSSDHASLTPIAPQLDSHSHSPRTQPMFRCRWQNCQSSTYFRREQDLIRHIRSIHLHPTAYACQIDGCRKEFGRKDHLQQHITRIHPSSYGLS
ncbi:hypothetical protein BJX99DRAFT_221874 [Aspergillus californicus]